MLFLSIAYGQKIFKDFWLIHAFVQMIVILFFSVITSWGIVFWVKKGDEFTAPYAPLLINIAMAIFIVILPLNWIRNRVEFSTNKEKFNRAVDIILRKKLKPELRQICQLPVDSEFLSLDGVVLVINKQNSQGVFFYIFRGAPEGVAGFLKIRGKEKPDDFAKIISDEYVTIKELGDCWFYISSE